MDLWEGVTLDYKVVLGYGIAMRMEKQEQALINGPIDTLVSNPDGTFGHTGLPTTINFDDANRNFDKGSLLNNRASAYGEMRIGGERFGGVASGAYFYDQVFHESNDNTSEDTVNNDFEAARSGNRTVPVNSFTAAARATSGERHRLLEAYVYGDLSLGESIALNVRYGRHLAAWGESLFFPGIVAAQGPFDATKSFVPGAEVKEILLPAKQLSINLALTSSLTAVGLYQFEFKPTEIFAVGDFFSPADLVGPGGSFGYSSVNPLAGQPCTDPNNLPDNQTELILCAAVLAGGALSDSPQTILLPREPDLLPDEKDKPWGAGLKYQLTPELNIGAYYLRYHNHNPFVRLNMGYAYLGAAAGTPITTELLGQRVPVSYNVGYADNIEMTAASFSTVLWGLNIGGELIQRKNVDTSVAADISNVRSPVATRGDTTQAQISWLYVINPDFLIYDELVVVGEAGWLHVDNVTPAPVEDGINYLGNRDVLFYDKESSAVQLQILTKGRNVFSGWDLGTPVSFAWLIDGTPSTPGAFGSLYGEGDMRYSAGITLQYLQNMEFSVTYNGFLGDPNRHIGQGSYGSSTLKANPYVDHDFLTFNVKYNL